MTHRILIPLTNHPYMGETGEANGTYAPELTHALAAFNDHGFEYTLVSIKGGEAPIYGLDDTDPTTMHVLSYGVFQDEIKNTKTLDDISLEDYDGIYYPGGFGLLSDLADDPGFAAVAAHMFESGKVVGAVCHGPAGLLPVTLSNGKPLLEGKTVTCFTREEEVEYGSIDKVPFVLEERIAKAAGQFTKKDPWAEHVVIDGKLVTGQNPASAGPVAKEMITLLTKTTEIVGS